MSAGKKATKQARSIELKIALNQQLREELLGGYKVATDHPIPVLAQDLALRVMALSRLHPIDVETINQLGWSLNSVGANFVEGCGRATPAWRLNFMRIARGSMYESIFHAKTLRVDFLDTVCLLATMLDDHMLGLLSQPVSLVDEIED